MIDRTLYIQLLGHLNNAHRAVTNALVDGQLPTELDPVLDAIDHAIIAVMAARIALATDLYSTRSTEPAAEWTVDGRDAEYIEPITIDEARQQMVHELHRAVYGNTGARPESPAFVWQELLHRVQTAARAFRR